MTIAYVGMMWYTVINSRILSVRAAVPLVVLRRFSTIIKTSDIQEDFDMTNIELAEKISAYLKGSKAKAKKFEDLVAVNFTLLDEDGSGDMYIEVREGALSVMPYHYDDYQANVTAAAEVFDKIFSGKLSIDSAVEEGSAKVEGDAAKFKALGVLIPSAAAKSAPKAAKPAAKKETKPAAKAPAAKAPAAKGSAKKK